MEKDFFTQEKCDRCGGDLKVRIMSWFTDDTLCMGCHDKETALRTALRDAGDLTNYEGCGYIPKLKE